MTDDAADLGRALLARAEALAAEYRDAARRRREEILADAARHLALREEREVLAAKIAAERAQRQQVQAAEIRLRADYDRLRWTLVQSVISQLDERLARLALNEAAYLPILEQLIAAGAATLPAREIVVEVNARDLARLTGTWETLRTRLAPDKTLVLGHAPLDASGGALLRDPDNRVRIDNTFEGRRQRLNDRLAQTVMERLFAGVLHG